MVPTPSTRELLTRWNTGDPAALEDLVHRDLDWVRNHVRRRLGAALRAREQTDDFVQEAMVELLRYGPRFVVESHAQFRRIIATIVENVLRGRHDWYHRQRRAISRERPLGADSVLDLGQPEAQDPSPSQVAMQKEGEAFVRLAVELLAPEDRDIIVAREWQGRPFEAIGTALGLTPAAARMRFTRAVARLGETAKRLKDGKLDEVLGPSERDGEPGDTTTQ